MAPSRRKRNNNRPDFDLASAWQELRENVSREALGLFFFLGGSYFGFTLIAAGSDAWIAHIVGWTAWLLAIVLLLIGVVLMLGERAGYWNPEALLGSELLLMGLAVGTFVRQHAEATWTPPAGGESGGLLGWGLGTLLVGGLGRWPAAFVVFLLLAGGVYLLVRHTPLIYLTPYAAGAAQIAWWRQRPEQDEGEPVSVAQPPLRPIDPAAARAAPAVDPAPADDPPADPPPDPAATPSPKRRKPARASGEAAKLQTVRAADSLPPIDLLEADGGRYGSRDTQRTQELIEKTLDDFNIPVRVVNVESGPTVTQYGLEPLYIERGGRKRKVRVSRIVSLADDIALALAAPSVRIEAPVPGYPYLGIEVPNNDKALVGLRGILESPEMKKRGGALPLALGRDTAGTPVVTDLTRAPHLLIAGATGSGKSVCINAIVTSLLMHHGPESLRFIMVDPKMVELPGYNGIPHLIGNVLTEMDHVVGALTWLLLQMDDRYQKFREAKVRNIAAYNEKARKKKSGLEPLPYLVLVVDELADLMMTAPEEVEKQLVRLAQMARATGVHMILATQRPSTDVVTGLIKANFPTRIAFAVTSQTDSRVILDSNGAEKLLGQGDMLFMRPDSAKLMRVQGCYVSDREIEAVVSFWKEWDRQAHPDGPPVRVAPWIGLMDRMDDEDELLLDAIDLIRGMESCSTSYVQRKLRIGYPKAARLMEQLEAKGVVGPDMGGGQGRPVLLKEEEGEEDS